MRARLPCSTHWGPAFEMLDRYKRIKEHLLQIQMIEVDELIPTASEENGIDKALKNFNNFLLSL